MSDLIGDVPDVGGSPLRVCVDGAVLTLGRPGQPLWRLGTGERDLLLRLLMRGEFAIEAEAAEEADGRAETDCQCPSGEPCPCEADGPDGFCRCCRAPNGEHRGTCAAGVP